MAREGGGDREFFIYLLIYSNRLAYLQPITVLVYRSSRPKSHKQGYLDFKRNKYRISSNKRRASNKCRPLISAAPLGIHIEISA